LCSSCASCDNPMWEYRLLAPCQCPSPMSMSSRRSYALAVFRLGAISVAVFFSTVIIHSLVQYISADFSPLQSISSSLHYDHLAPPNKDWNRPRTTPQADKARPYRDSPIPFCEKAKVQPHRTALPRKRIRLYPQPGASIW